MQVLIRNLSYRDSVACTRYHRSEDGKTAANSNRKVAGHAHLSFLQPAKYKNDFTALR